MLLVFFSILLRQKQRKNKIYIIIYIQYIWKSNVFLVVLSLDIEMLDWNMVKTKTLSWKKKWKACSLSLKEMFRICNLAVKHFFFLCCRMIQVQKITNGHAQWEYWPLENFKGFYISKKWLQNRNKIEKQLASNHLYQPVFMPMKSQYYIPGSTTQSFIFHSRTPFYWIECLQPTA